MKRLAIIAAGLTLTATALPALPAAAAGNPSANLAAPLVTVRSTGGVNLQMSISASRSSGSTQLIVRLNSPSSAGNEAHAWYFPVPSSALSYASPKGKLVSGTKLGPYGAVSLVFTKVSSSTRSCSGLSGKTQVTTTIVKFRGSINFAARDTNGPSQWGTVKQGSASAPYTFGGKKGSYVTTTNGTCNVAFPTPRCFELWTWTVGNNAATNSQTSLEGDSRNYGTGTVSAITAFRGQALPSPAGASRIDTNIVPAPTPQFSGAVNPNSLQVTTTDGSSATGGGTFTASGNPTHPPGGKCKRSDGTTTTQTASFWTATWKNSQTTLVVSMNIGGPISVPDGNQGYFEHISNS